MNYQWRRRFGGKGEKMTKLAKVGHNVHKDRTAKCSFCGKIFKKFNSRHIYCSLLCQGRASRTRGKYLA